MTLFGYVLVKDVEYKKQVAETWETYLNNKVSYEEGLRDGFRKGADHIINSMKTAVEKENINFIWKINHPKIDDLKFLANALLGSYAKRK